MLRHVVHAEVPCAPPGTLRAKLCGQSSSWQEVLLAWGPEVLHPPAAPSRDRSQWLVWRNALRASLRGCALFLHGRILRLGWKRTCRCGHQPELFGLWIFQACKILSTPLSIRKI